MVFDYSLAGLVITGLLFYLVYALLRPELFRRDNDHDRHRLDERQEQPRLYGACRSSEFLIRRKLVDQF